MGVIVEFELGDIVEGLPPPISDLEGGIGVVVSRNKVVVGPNNNCRKEVVEIYWIISPPTRPHPQYPSLWFSHRFKRIGKIDP